MIHIDRDKGTGVLSGSMPVLLNDFANIARGLYTSMEEGLGEKLARRMLSDVFEQAISTKTENMLKIVTPAEKQNRC